MSYSYLLSSTRRHCDEGTHLVMPKKRRTSAKGKKFVTRNYCRVNRKKVIKRKVAKKVIKRKVAKKVIKRKVVALTKKQLVAKIGRARFDKLGKKDLTMKQILTKHNLPALRAMATRLHLTY